MTKTFNRTATNHVAFTDEEWGRIAAIAKGRVDRNAKRGRGREGAASLRAQEIGVAAEVAFGLAAGIAAADVWRAAASPAPTGGWHYTLDGTTVRVQGTDRPGHLVERVSQAKAEVYVLCYCKPEERTVSLIGWVPRDELVRARVDTRSGPGWTLTSYWVPSGDLLWMSRLWTVLAVAA